MCWMSPSTLRAPPLRCDVLDDFPLDPHSPSPHSSHDVYDELPLDPQSPPQVNHDVFDELPSTLGTSPRR